MILLANHMLGNYLIMENNALGEVVYGVSRLDRDYQIDGLIVTPPDPLYTPSTESAPIVKMFANAVHHPFIGVAFS
jgi:hypothetical protein